MQGKKRTHAELTHELHRLDKRYRKEQAKYASLLGKYQALQLAEHAVLQENARLKDFINGLQITTSFPVIHRRYDTMY
jgi:molybdenum-dependent DNA-binding transcriptional regulator ModE